MGLACLLGLWQYSQGVCEYSGVTYTETKGGVKVKMNGQEPRFFFRTSVEFQALICVKIASHPETCLQF